MPKIFFGSRANDLEWLRQNFKHFIVFIDLLAPTDLRVATVGHHVFNTG